MAHPNEEAVRRGYAAFAAGDLESLRTLFAPDIKWHVPGRNPLSGTYQGIDQVFQFFGRLAQLTEGTFHIDLHDVLANDEHVVALIHAHAQRPGKTLDGNEAHVFNMKGGQVTEFWSLDEDQYAGDEFFS
jgi:ketosteroid isomerase-like protein